MAKVSIGAFTALLLAVGAGGCATESTDDAPLAVVVDTDMGIDDVRALMFLLESDNVDIRAVTVAGSGLARCPEAAINAAALLRTFDRADIPVACGPRAPLEGYNVAPTPWRDEATLLTGMNLDRSGLEDTIGDADALLRETLSDNDDLTILALGPLTNIAPVLNDPGLADAVSEVRVMGGAFGVGGNIFSFTNVVSEFNIWIDPAAAQQVLDSGVAVSFVPLDATNSVPVSPATLNVFAGGTTRSSELLQGFYEANPLRGGVFHWDDLAAASLVDPTLVEFEDMSVAVTTEQESDELGRTATVAPDDGITARVAVSADRDRFEQLLFQTVAGSSETTRNAWAPEATITFDGARCAYDGPDPPPADLELEIVNDSATPAMGVVVGVYDPGTTLEQAADFAAADSDRPPPWFELITVAPLPTRTSSIWVFRDLPSDVSFSCARTISDVTEIAGVRLPT